MAQKGSRRSAHPVSVRLAVARIRLSFRSFTSSYYVTKAMSESAHLPVVVEYTG
uniref:Uncharacterized protein n=1 Tax=Anguilla anguilla TaxID=7936 RepID=A0A0E9UTE8_ANGAN